MERYVWVATGYLLAAAASMPIWGKLSDAYGRKRSLSSAWWCCRWLGALRAVHTMTELIAYRAFQGLGAGAMMPISQAILGDVFPPAKRARFMGVLMSVFGVAMIIGPLLGGWITDNISWRWVFYVNLPVGIVAIAFCLWALPGHVTLHKHRLDYPGSVLLVAAAVPLLLAFSWAGVTYPWLSWPVIGGSTFSAVVWVVFFVGAARLRAGDQPAPVRQPHLYVSSAASSLQNAAMFGAVMFLPLFVQIVQGHSATNSGVILMPMMFAAIVASVAAGQLIARNGRYKALVIAGFAVSPIGAYLLRRMTIDSGGPPCGSTPP